MVQYDPRNWLSLLLRVRGSVLPRIAGRTLIVLVIGVVVVLLERVEVVNLSIPAAAHTLVGIALGLLLVFRTNASYDRFWEGRRMWGNIINESRNLARFCHAHLANAAAVRRRTLLWLVAFVYASMHRLRGGKGLGPAVESLPAGEVCAVLDSDHVPLAAARQITSCLVEARDQGVISDYLLVDGDQNVQLLVDYIGACERIHRTPLPFAYMVHLRRALLLYCYTLPLALVSDFGWWTIPCTLLVAYVLLGIEEIGVEIEDPFGDDENDLPLEQFCETIRANVEGLEVPTNGVMANDQ